MKKVQIKLVALLFLGFFWGLILSASAGAAPLGVVAGKPNILFDQTGSASYDAVTDMYEVLATPLGVVFSDGQPSVPIANGSLVLQFHINSSGQLTGGVAGADFTITGDIDEDGDGTIDYSGILLTGEISAFGYWDSAGTTDYWDFRLIPTSGSLMSFYNDADIAVTFQSENSTFSGSFNVNFHGNAKGNVGPIPQLCTGSIGDYVWHDKDRDGVQDADEPGIPDVTVKLYDGLGNEIASTVTDGSGAYHFTGLCADNYSVDVIESTVPSGYFPTDFDQGNDMLDSDSINGAPVDITLPLNNTIDDSIDFGFQTPCTGSLGDFVWHDTNRNGIQDAGEPGLADVRVILRDGSGNLIDQTTTDANGFYLFNGLCIGNYSIDVDESTVPLPAGFLSSDADQGVDDSKDSDSINGAPVLVSLPLDDAEDLDTDFGFYTPCTGTIGNYVWQDEDRDGIQDAGEAVLTNVRVVLTDATGNFIAETFTDSNGFYSFTGLCAGNYLVDVDESTIPTGFFPTDADQGDDALDSDSVNGAPVNVTLALESSSDDTIDFGFQSPCTGVLGDFVWHDANRNGIQDAGEPGLPHVKVILKDAAGNPVAVTTTDGDGFYSFSGICQGDYFIDVDESTVPLPAGFVPTDADQGLDDTQDSDAVNGNPVSVTLPLDTAKDLDTDFGFYTPCTGTLGNYVWHDEDRDGIQDAGEAVLTNVRVVLTDATGNFIAETFTDANGFYHFTGLCSGDYRVDIDESTVPTGFFPTDANQGVDDALDSDAVNGAYVVATLAFDDAVEDTIDFGFQSPCTGLLGDFVWHDLNRNGIQDAGEPGLANVQVTLKDAAGNVIDTTNTDANGFYSFNGLCLGDYFIDVNEGTVPLPPGFVPSEADRGVDDAQDSDAVDGNPVSVNLPEDGFTDLNTDFGFYTPCSGTIGDYVWQDEDRDGVQDPGEATIANVRVVLTDASGNFIAETLADSNGFYSFNGLCAGSYLVDVDESTIPDGFFPTAPNQGGDDARDSDSISGNPVEVALMLDESQDLTIDFGFQSPCAGQLGDYVWHDMNQNGIQDASEPGLADVRVELKNVAGNVIAVTTTDASGFYSFSGLCFGDYFIDVDESTVPLLVGFVSSPAHQGADDAQDSDSENGNPVAVMLPLSDAQDLDTDFGYYVPCTGSIGDYVWDDANHNGVQDAGEPGIANVTVNLLDAAGNVIATKVTDASGAYRFEGLCAADYSVDVDEGTLPPGMTPVPADQGGDDGKDSDSANGNPVPVTLPNDDSTDGTIDFGFETPCTGSLGDYVWDDANHNGVQDAGEPGIANVTVNLLDAAGNVIATTVTDASGAYRFEGLCAGDYRVDVDEGTVPAGMVPVSADQGNDDAQDSDSINGAAVAVTLPNGNSSNETIDFGFEIPSASLGDRVWFDNNRNGIQDAGESGVPNVTVSLFDGNGILLATSSTNANGNYLFNNLNPGDYFVRFSNLPLGYQFSQRDQGVNDAQDSDADPASGATAAATLSAGENDLSWDAGINLISASLGDYVWEDLNANGIQDDGNSGINDVTVNLRQCNGAPVASTVTTDDSSGNPGFYEFTDLEPGCYQVEFIGPAGYLISPRQQGADLALDSDGPVSDPINLTAGQHNPTIDAGMHLLNCSLVVEKSCVVEAPPTQDLLCQDKIAATTWLYTGPTHLNATVEISGSHGGFARYEDVDLISGQTVLTDPSQNGFTIDGGTELGSKTYIQLFDTNGKAISGMEEIIHTSCSAVYSADAPAPLDSGTPNPPSSSKGDPSPNWYVINFRDKAGALVEQPQPTAGSSECSITAQAEECTKRPRELTLRYEPRICSDSSHSQPSDKWNCSGEVSGSVHLLASNGSDIYFDGNVDAGGTVLLDPAMVGRSDLDSNIDFLITDTHGNVQTLNFHTSCSQPLFAGDIYGSLEVVSYRNDEQGLVQLGADVNYAYSIHNAGSHTVTNISVVDDLLGNINGSPIASLLAGESITLHASAFVASSITNTATVNGLIEGQSCPDGPYTATTTVAVITPPEPQLSCSELKPVTALSMVWDGPDGIDITTEGGEQFINVQKGNKITFSTIGLGNDVDLNLSGALEGLSRFHVSCSDNDMQDVSHCGSAQGNSKDNDSSRINLWLLQGMTGENGSFNCDLPNSGMVVPTDGGGASDGGVVPNPEGAELKDKEFKWKLTNTNSYDIYITEVQVTWPAEQGLLVKLKLDGDTFADDVDQVPPSTILSLVDFVLDAKKRKIKADETREFKIQFDTNYSDDQLSDYKLKITFDNGDMVKLNVP